MAFSEVLGASKCLRVIYRREFHIYLIALYALRRAKPILTRLVPMMTSTGFGMPPRKFVQDYEVANALSWCDLRVAVSLKYVAFTLSRAKMRQGCGNS
jgi:hypothetical protein